MKCPFLLLFIGPRPHYCPLCHSALVILAPFLFLHCARHPLLWTSADMLSLQALALLTVLPPSDQGPHSQ